MFQSGLEPFHSYFRIFFLLLLGGGGGGHFFNNNISVNKFVQFGLPLFTAFWLIDILCKCIRVKACALSSTMNNLKGVY